MDSSELLSTMTNYEYILAECKNAHYHQWIPTAIEACVSQINKIIAEEL